MNMNMRKLGSCAPRLAARRRRLDIGCMAPHERLNRHLAVNHVWPGALALLHNLQQQSVDGAELLWQSVSRYASIGISPRQQLIRCRLSDELDEQPSTHGCPISPATPTT